MIVKSAPRTPQATRWLVHLVREAAAAAGAPQTFAQLVPGDAGGGTALVTDRVKDSGVGREGPRFAVAEPTVTRMAVIRP